MFHSKKMGQALNPSSYEFVVKDQTPPEEVPVLCEEHAKELVDFYPLSETKETLINKTNSLGFEMTLRDCTKGATSIPNNEAEMNMYLNMCMINNFKKNMTGRGTKCYGHLLHDGMEYLTPQQKQEVMKRMEFCAQVGGDELVQWTTNTLNFKNRLESPGSLKRIMPNVIQFLKSRYVTDSTDPDNLIDNYQIAKGENMAVIMLMLNHPILAEHALALSECAKERVGSCEKEFQSLMYHASSLINRNAIIGCMKEEHPKIPIEEMPFRTFTLCSSRELEYTLDGLQITPTADGKLHFHKEIKNLNIEIRRRQHL